MAREIVVMEKDGTVHAYSVGKESPVSRIEGWLVFYDKFETLFGFPLNKIAHYQVFKYQS